MPQIEVVLDVPMKIAKGLASGQLEREGGVIREAGSKQIVAWLREGGKIGDNSNLAGGALRSILDVGGIGILNLAATAVSTAIVLKRLKDLEQEIKNLGNEITGHLAQDRQVKMDAAIHAANLAFDIEGASNRESMARDAILKLFEARQHIWRDIDKLKGSSHSAEHNELMQKNIEQAMRLDTLYSRCLLLLENTSRAREYLESNLNDYRETTRALVHRHLGSHRAAYFHNSILETDLLRYIAVEQWLRPSGNRLLEILLGNRSDFWNKDVADGKSIKKPGRQKYIDALTQSELLIENYHRLRGFHAEIEAIERLRITQAEWTQQQEDALTEAEKNLADFTTLEDYDDYILLVDKQWDDKQSNADAT